MQTKLIICALALILLSGCGSGSQSTSTLANIDELPGALMAERYDQVYNSLSDDFRSRVTKAQIKTLSQSFFETEDLFEIKSRYALNAVTDYIWLNSSGSKGIAATADQDGVIWGMQIVNLASYTETDNAYTKQEYSLPLKGNWFTFWGGSNVLLNYHYAYETQRYAYDFVAVKEGFSYEGDPSRNESFHAFEREVLAPADGVIVEVVNDVEDNAPVGTMNEKQAAGNYIIIDHQGEYSILAHFKQGSITVREGQKVQRGDLLGLTGNSGNSSEAHIHFQVSDQPSLEQGKSIRIKFVNGLDPVKGQFIEG
ncbi:M23 family metallopeptidase [Paenibacillus sp. YSY-4.3]